MQKVQEWHRKKSSSSQQEKEIGIFLGLSPRKLLAVGPFINSISMCCQWWLDCIRNIRVFFVNEFILIIYFLAALDLFCCTQAFSSCGAWASHCGGFSCGRAQVLGTRASVLAACGLQRAGSIVVAQGPNCSVAHGIFPDQGLNPSLLYWQVNSLPLSHQERVLSPLEAFKQESCSLDLYLKRSFWPL